MKQPCLIETCRRLIAKQLPTGYPAIGCTARFLLKRYRATLILTCFVIVAGCTTRHGEFMERGRVEFSAGNYAAAAELHAQAGLEAHTGINRLESLLELAKSAEKSGDKNRARIAYERAFKLLNFCMRHIQFSQGYCPIPAWTSIPPASSPP